MSQPQGDAKRAASAPIDLLTVAGIGVLAYLLSSITHEALGHGVAALVVGAHIQHITSVDMSWDSASVSDWSRRFVAAAGCGAQIIVALIVLWVMSFASQASANVRYFLWLFSTINILIPGGYLMVLSLANFGDWNDFVQGLPSPSVWRVGLTVVGVAISIAGLVVGARNIEPFVGRAASGPETRRKRRVTLTFTPYLVGSAALTASAVFNPDSPTLILLSGAAASFGGTAWLMLINAVRRTPAADAVDAPISPTRSWLWIGLGVLSLIVYFFVLGPGLPR